MNRDKEIADRKIIHVDMDAFFASVEQRDNAELRGRPVAVGGSAKRGVVAAASYEARKFGVRSAMPSVTALRRCPDLIFVPSRFDVYREVSSQIRRIFSRYTNLIEPLSLDEAYLDVTDDQQRVGSATHTARLIRMAIARETGLTASAGISYNKFLAKIASDQNKPDGQCVIRPTEGKAFVAALSVRRFHGVGPRTAERMAKLNIITGGDLRQQSLEFMELHFGKSSAYLYNAARGVDHRPVVNNRIRKSVGREQTYTRDLCDESDLRKALREVVDSVWPRLLKQEVRGRTVTVKVKYADFRQITRSASFDMPVTDRLQLLKAANSLLASVFPLEQGVRLLGVSLSSLIQISAGNIYTATEQRDTNSWQHSFDF